MKLYQKLLFGFACVALLVSCVGYVAQQMNERVERSVVQLSEVAVNELSGASDLSAALRESLVAARGAASARSASDFLAARAALDESFSQFESALVVARSATSTGRSRADRWDRADMVERQNRKLSWLESAAAAFDEFRLATDETLAGGAGPHALLAIETVLEPQAAATLSPPLSQYREAARTGFSAEASGMRDVLSQANRFLFMAVLLGIGMTLVLGILIANSIAAPLLVITEATRTFGRGRFDHRVRIGTKDEVAELASALNRMAEELGQTTVSKYYLDNILKSMADPLLVLNEEGQISLVNEAVAQTLGYDSGELIGSSVGVILCDGEAGATYVLDTIRQWGRTGHMEMNLCTREGAELPVIFSGAIMRGAEGETQGIVCVAKDITQQKLVERELVTARERAEEMARLKSSFLANMSHEIRTPLTGIIGSAQVLEEVTDGDAGEMAAIIERAGVRLLSTINSVLDMARIEAGELHPTYEPVCLVDEVRDTTGVLHRLAQAKNLRFEVIERQPGVWVSTDVGFLQRIVTNLVGNAIKFTEHGSVTVEIDAEGDHTAVLRVRDTGIGISQEFLPHLFDEFRQESSGLERRHEGSGLGLAITKSLVDLLGAELSVESTRESGTTFTVTLLRTVEPPPGPPRRQHRAVEIA